MKTFSLAFPASLAALGLIASSGAALAMHVKPGLWQVSVKIDMPGMPQLSPDQLAKMKALGIHVPVGGDAITTTHCVTAAEATMDKMPDMGRAHSKECTIQNMSMTGGGMSADMVCTGKMQGRSGHIAFHVDSPEHYSGRITMSGVVDGAPKASSTTIDAKFVSADCKADQ
jgi:hypothetical protein